MIGYLYLAVSALATCFLLLTISIFIRNRRVDKKIESMYSFVILNSDMLEVHTEAMNMHNEALKMQYDILLKMTADVIELVRAIESLTNTAKCEKDTANNTAI